MTKKEKEKKKKKKKRKKEEEEEESTDSRVDFTYLRQQRLYIRLSLYRVSDDHTSL